MDFFLSVLFCLFLRLFNYAESVPPAVCFENFQWGDCGSPPQAVIYYYKPGSRCEVAFWRGCLPNPNMFKDEYECVNTCIYTVKAQPKDYHRTQYSEELYNETIIHLKAEIKATTTDSSTDVTDDVRTEATGGDDGNTSGVNNGTEASRDVDESDGTAATEATVNEENAATETQAPN